MSLAALMALILGLSLTAYAVLAGADFGAGILDLQLGTGARGRVAGHGGARDRPSDGGTSDRETIAAAIGPLWEANHVWLIFSITILFSAFPRAFSAIGTSLLAPFTVALLAIVVRSGALGVRSSTATSARSYRLLSIVFGLASVVAPFAFGTIAGGVAQASIAAAPSGGGTPTIPWTSPFALVVGALAVAVCAQLAAGFVTLRCARWTQVAVTERFRRRALRSGIAAALLMAGGLIVAASDSPSLWHHLMGVALPAVATGAVLEGVALIALAQRRYLIAHGAAVGATAMVLWGWFVAQTPRLAGPRLTLHAAAATHTALVAVAVAVGAVLVAVVPAMLLLFMLFNGPAMEVPE